MASRHGVHITKRGGAEGGQSPRSYISYVSVDLRIFYPPGVGNMVTAIGVLEDAVTDARAELFDRIREGRLKLL